MWGLKLAIFAAALQVIASQTTLVSITTQSPTSSSSSLTSQAPSSSSSSLTSSSLTSSSLTTQSLTSSSSLTTQSLTSSSSSLTSQAPSSSSSSSSNQASCLDSMHLELALLMDGSHSATDDKSVVQVQFPQLMTNLTRDLGGRTKFAFASFIDKPVFPFGWPSDYCVNVTTPLTSDQYQVVRGIDELWTRGGFDWREGSLDALLDLAWRPRFGWSANDTDPDGRRNLKMIALATDAGFHEAGDSSLEERVLGPLDCKGQDYPSVSLVASQLKAKHIVPVFMVKHHAFRYWYDLQLQLEMLGVPSFVKLLKLDSSNIYELIENIVMHLCGEPEMWI